MLIIKSVLSRKNKDRMFNLAEDAISKGTILEYGDKIPERLQKKAVV